MSATTLLCQLAGVSPCVFSKQENQLLEINLFSRICDELKEIYKIQYRDYFRIIKLNTEMENNMLETNFLRSIINDILSTEEYTLEGLALYTHAHEEIIFEIASGKNTDPAISLVRKIVELHRSVRPSLYQNIIDKIIQKRTETDIIKK